MSYIPKEMRERVLEQSGGRCGYCLSRPEYTSQPLEIEHIQPSALGGSDHENNLWASCRLCNGYKSLQTRAIDPETQERIPLFNPRFQQWSEHFKWSDDGVKVIGLTPCGRATVIALQLNNFYSVTARRNWVKAGWHPPTD